MSVQSEINRIKTAVGAAYDAISDKGGTVPASETAAGLASAINSIPNAAVTSVNGATGDVTGAQAVAGAAIEPGSVNVGGVAWVATKNDGGDVVVNNAAGTTVVELNSTDDRRGVVTVSNPDGSLAVRLYAETTKNGGAIIRNAYGANIINLISNLSGYQGYSGTVHLRNASGSARATLGVDTSDNGVLTLVDSSGNAYTLTPSLINKLKTL